jgi:hypothetical protein
MVSDGRIFFADGRRKDIGEWRRKFQVQQNPNLSVNKDGFWGL